MKKTRVVAVCLSLCAATAMAEDSLRIDFAQAVEMAHKADKRISEKEKLVGVAKGLLQEAEGAESWVYDVNAFVGLSPQIKSGNFINEEGNFDASALDFDGVSPWYNLEFRIIYPLSTFGRAEHYADAAKGNIRVKQGDVQIQRSQTYIDVATAYNGYLAARDTRYLLEDAGEKISSALELVEGWLEEDEGKAKQSDVFALQTGRSLIAGFLAEARGLENVALAGLKFLVGVDKETKLELADKRIEPVELPSDSLAIFKDRALKERPEMTQVEQGLTARRALVKANKSEFYPILYTGVGGVLSYSPLREPTDDISVYDPFNSYGATPVLGIKWDWHSGRQEAKVVQAQAELDALLEKKQFALQGIPFQVAEQYHQVHLYHEKVEKLYEGARAGRRWLISSYADFEAGIEESDKLVNAFQGYLLVYSDYLRSVNNYNVHVAKLKVATGEVK